MGVLVIAAAVAAGYLMLLGRPLAELPHPMPVVVSSPPSPADLPPTLSEAKGAVQIRTGEGAWHNAAVGMALEPGSDLRTGVDGHAALTYADSINVAVDQAAELRVERVNADVARLVVREGLAIVDVKPEGGRLLQVAAYGSDAVVETRDGRVHLQNDGQGHVQAAVTRGTAILKARGEQVELGEGFASSVAPGAKPTRPFAMPKSLLLKVKWPPEASTAKRRHLVVGTTNPGARVRIGELVAVADERGRFQVVIELNEGTNHLRAYALDVFGRVQQAEAPPVELDTRAPAQEIQTDPEMWNRPK